MPSALSNFNWTFRFFALLTVFMIGELFSLLVYKNIISSAGLAPTVNNMLPGGIQYNHLTTVADEFVPLRFSLIVYLVNNLTPFTISHMNVESFINSIIPFKEISPTLRNLVPFHFPYLLYASTFLGSCIPCKRDSLLASWLIYTLLFVGFVILLQQLNNNIPILHIESSVRMIFEIGLGAYIGLMTHALAVWIDLKNKNGLFWTITGIAFIVFIDKYFILLAKYFGIVL